MIKNNLFIFVLRLTLPTPKLLEALLPVVQVAQLEESAAEIAEVVVAIVEAIVEEMGGMEGPRQAMELLENNVLALRVEF